MRTRRYRDENKISQPTPFASISSYLINAEGFYFKKGGTFSFYTFGKNYEPLCGQHTAGRDLVITATDKIVGYLNEKAHTNFKTNNKLTRRYIFERLAEGYTAQDFKAVIDKKYDDWAETEFEKYLRPSTLFGDRFEGYLNEAKYKKKYCDPEGTK